MRVCARLFSSVRLVRVLVGGGDGFGHVLRCDLVHVAGGVVEHVGERGIVGDVQDGGTVGEVSGEGSVQRVKSGGRVDAVVENAAAGDNEGVIGFVGSPTAPSSAGDGADETGAWLMRNSACGRVECVRGGGDAAASCVRALLACVAGRGKAGLLACVRVAICVSG